MNEPIAIILLLCFSILIGCIIYTWGYNFNKNINLLINIPTVLYNYEVNNIEHIKSKSYGDGDGNNNGNGDGIGDGKGKGTIIIDSINSNSAMVVPMRGSVWDNIPTTFCVKN